jgi:carbonic anhydrase
MPEFQALIDGYRRFRTGDYRVDRERWDRLAQGQAPKVMVVACSDSRVDPTRVFDSEPGQMFVLRNIANLVPPFAAIEGQSSVAAALEYAVTVIEVHHIVVFGHARCGGIAAALQGALDEGRVGIHVRRWMDFIAPARETVQAAQALAPDIDAQKALEQASARLSLDNLRTYPFVAEAVARRGLKLQAVIFDIADGSLRVLDPADGQFRVTGIEL